MGWAIKYLVGGKEHEIHMTDFSLTNFYWVGKGWRTGPELPRGTNLLNHPAGTSVISS